MSVMCPGPNSVQALWSTLGCRGVDPEQHQGVGLRYPSQRTLDSEFRGGGGIGKGYTVPRREHATQQVCLLQEDVDVHVRVVIERCGQTDIFDTIFRRTAAVFASSAKLCFDMQTCYPQLQVSRWPSPSQETQPPSRRCSRGALGLKAAGIREFSANRWKQAWRDGSFRSRGSPQTYSFVIFCEHAGLSGLPFFDFQTPDLIVRVAEYFTAMFRRKAFLHWYTGEGSLRCA